MCGIAQTAHVLTPPGDSARLKLSRNRALQVGSLVALATEILSAAITHQLRF
jgi:hypothetical protein